MSFGKKVSEPPENIPQEQRYTAQNNTEKQQQQMFKSVWETRMLYRL